MKTKTFDCVEMKHQGAAHVQEQLAGMAQEEEIAFWQSGTEELRQQQKQAIGEIKTMPLPDTETPKRNGRAQSGRE